MSATITPTQMAVIEHARMHGGLLYRHAGGIWQSAPMPTNYLRPVFRSKAIYEAVAAGLFKVTAWRIDGFGKKSVFTVKVA